MSLFFLLVAKVKVLTYTRVCMVYSLFMLARGAVTKKVRKHGERERKKEREKERKTSQKSDHIHEYHFALWPEGGNKKCI